MNKLIIVILLEDGKHQIRCFEPGTGYDAMQQELIKEFGGNPGLCSSITKDELLERGYDVDAIAKELDEIEVDDE